MLKVKKLYKDDYPEQLKQITRLPNSFDIAGEMPPVGYKYLCVVGSRGYSNYGEEVCRRLISGLANHPIAIVSGMAMGIDSIAHEVALEFKMRTLAFPGSGLLPHVLYPFNQKKLAERIVAGGGAVLSQFEPWQPGQKWTFPERNRTMAGISQAVLIIEAKKKSGTLITANHALEFCRDVCVVPGSILSELSQGPHSLLRSGAIPVTSSGDILEVLGFDMPKGYDQSTLFDLDSIDLDLSERSIMERLRISPLSSTELIEKTLLSAIEFNSVISGLELRGLVCQIEGVYRLSSFK